MIHSTEITRLARPATAGGSATSSRLDAQYLGAFQSVLELAGGAGSGDGSIGDLPTIDPAILNQLARMVRSVMAQGSGGANPAAGGWSGVATAQPDSFPMEPTTGEASHATTGNPRIAKPSAVSDQELGYPQLRATPAALARELAGTQGGAGSGERFAGVITQAAKAYDLDPRLISAVVATESGFNPNAVSPVGAQGLMQLMPATARELGVTNPFDPEQNIMAGSKYLKSLLNRYQGNREMALAAYNWGMGNLERNPGAMPTETRNYVRKISSLMEGGVA